MKPMPSSTFSSNERTVSDRAQIRTIWILLATLVLLLAAFELFARIYVERHSKVQREVNAEYAEAVKINRSGRKQLLIVGNSLVGHGVDFGFVRSTLPADWEAHRFWIYNTGYEDWYFGLRRLMAEGSRPDVVAVVFAGLNWYDSGIRGDYSSQYLFQTRDLPRIKSELDLDRTTTTGLLFAHYSKFYALRTEIRKQLLQAVVPDLPHMYNLIKPGQSRPITDAEIADLLTGRISAYRDILKGYNARLVLIVPPLPRPGAEHQGAIRLAAARAGIEAVIPLSCAAVPAADFADDMHLTPEGARLFTAAFIRQLVPALNAAAAGTNRALRSSLP
jgi:hypothetical protein